MKKEKDAWVIELGEVKSSEIGEEMLLRGQRKRLFESGRFLSALFGVPSKLIRLLGNK